jgi:Domain of unknown function (DUF1918)
MIARVGDEIHVHSRTVDAPDRVGKIAEVRGENGQPPYLVRFDDGHETVMYPGPDTTIESPGTE